MKEPFYLGLDLSTQSLTAALIEPFSGKIVGHSINFGDCFPAYRTDGG